MSSAIQSLLALGVGIVAAGAVYVAEGARPKLFHQRHTVLTWAIVAASAAGAAVAPPTPTGIDGLDVAYRVVFALAVTLAAGRARRGARIVAGTLAAVGSAGAWPWTLAAFGGLGLASGAASIRRPARPLGVAIGALQVQALLRLAWPDPAYTTAALATVAAVVLLVSGVRHARRHERGPARVVLGLVGAAGFVVVVLLAIGAFQVQGDLRAGARAANAGLDAVRAGDTTTAVDKLDRAQRRLRSADDGLRAAWLRPARVFPVAGRYLAAGRDLTAASLDVLDPALRSARLADDDALRIVDAHVDLDAVAALRPPLEDTLAAVPGARAAVAQLQTEPLPGPVAREVDDLDRTLTNAIDDGDTALEALDLVPQLLGGSGPRRWFVLMQTTSEQRASGGIAGGYGVLSVDDGTLELVEAGAAAELTDPGEEWQLGSVADEYERFAGFGPERYFQNVTNVPNFPAVGEVISQIYPQAGGAPVDGVISVDPKVLAALLELAGPIEVPNWPEQLTADNVERALLHQQYLRFADDSQAGDQFVTDVIQATFAKLQTGDLPAPGKFVHELAPMVRAGRLKLYSPRPAEEALFETMGADGAMPAVDGDFFELVTQNSGQSKIDWFQHRTVDYQARYDPVTGQVNATATVTITNGAPAEGQSELVIGGAFPDEGPLGRSRLYVDFYSALNLDGFTIDGTQSGLSRDRAYGRNLYWTIQTLLPGQTITFQLYLSGLLDPGSPYRLDLGMQPVVWPDDVSVSVALAGDAPIRSATGLRVDDGTASATFEQHAPRRFVVRGRPESA